MEHTPKFTATDIEAYVDGQLTGRQRTEIEAWLRENPELEKKVQEDFAITEALGKSYAHILDEPVPAHLLDLFRQEEHRQKNGQANNFFRRFFALRPGMPQAGGAAAVAVVFFAMGGLWNGGFTSGQLQNTITDGHREVMLMNTPDGNDFTKTQTPSTQANSQAVNVIAPQAVQLNHNGQNDSQPASQPLNWLTQKIALETKAPDLSSQGFSLVDRKLVTYEGQKSVQLLYRNAAGKELSLYMKARWQPQPPVFQYQNNDGSASVVWEDGPLLYALAGADLERDLGVSLAQTVRQAMADSEPTPQVQPQRPPKTVILQQENGNVPSHRPHAGQGENGQIAPQVIDVYRGAEEQF